MTERKGKRWGSQNDPVLKCCESPRLPRSEIQRCTLLGIPVPRATWHQLPGWRPHEGYDITAVTGPPTGLVRDLALVLFIGCMWKSNPPSLNFLQPVPWGNESTKAAFKEANTETAKSPFTLLYHFHRHETMLHGAAYSPRHPLVFLSP